MANKAATGQWVRVRITTGTQFARMGFGGEEPAPAFIDNVRGRRGIETYAKRRCPNLRPGRHAVRVITDDEVTEVAIQVV